MRIEGFVISTIKLPEKNLAAASLFKPRFSSRHSRTLVSALSPIEGLFAQTANRLGIFGCGQKILKS